MRSTLHEASVFRLGIFALAALLVPQAARADEPAPPPANTPAAPPASTDAPSNQPAPPPTAPLPDSVRAMVNHLVVLRLKDERTVEGRLIAAGDSGFIVERADGSRETVPRSAARSVRLSESDRFDTRGAAKSGPGGLEMNPAGGEEPNPDQGADFQWKAPQRIFGLGTSFGGGFSGADTFSGRSGTGILPALLLPTLELQVFLPREYSLDLVMPVLNMAVVSAVVKGAFVSMDLVFNANAGSGKTRFVVGPGIGFSYLDSGYGSATSLRIPGQIGFEVLSKSRGFGFKMLARPWAELAFGSATNAVGGGLVGALVFTGYVTDRSGAGQ